jgi:hypothetical protein
MFPSWSPALRRSDLSIAPRCPRIRHSGGVTYLLDKRAMTLGQQVTPTEYRSLHYPRAIERTLLRSVAIPTARGDPGVFAQSQKSDGIPNGPSHSLGGGRIFQVQPTNEYGTS